MAEAAGAGGAEMGQRSKRVTAASPSSAIQKLSTESFSAEGTWMPTFGVQGLDVSAHQPSVDWKQQWNMGARFAYVKASEGNYYTNELFNSQYQGSRSVGMLRGAYHFAIPNWSSGADQARYFVANGGGWSADGYTMPPVLDFEFNPYEGRTINGFYFGNTCYNMSPAQLSSWVRDFGNTMQSLTGRLPVIYTNTSWWNQCLGNPAGFGDFPLWTAAYPSSATNNAGPVPTGSWDSYSIWQYSSTGPFAGDSNVWNGDYASLQRFAGAAFPTGSFDDLAVERGSSEVALRARGWSVDLANIPASNQTHVYVTAPDGVTTGYAWTANTSRLDVNQTFGYGASHGFDGRITITKSGTYKACAYSIGSFGNTALGCKTIVATGVAAPTGSFDSLGQVRSADKVSLQVRGWAVDLANPAAATFADAYITGPDGSTTGYRLTANTSRPDVDAATGLGTNHGFDTQIKVSIAGTYSVCVHSIGINFNTPLGCKKFTVETNPAPIGSYDTAGVVQAPGSARLQVTGWTLDRAVPGTSTPVHIYVHSPDGSTAGYAFTAGQPRPDVNQALGTIGNHGYNVQIDIDRTGTYTVCAYAIPLAPLAAGNTTLGCSAVTVVQTPGPTGYLDSVKVRTLNGQTSLLADGWTFDPAVPGTSNPVHIYVTYPDGTRKAYPFTADRSRLDVNQAFGITGNHGYSAALPLTQRGPYSVCAYGITIAEFGAGNPLLGCKSLTF
jgi:GH25 family lysozyme M1 (1,4-beta-N-acetylmuramidase)